MQKITPAWANAERTVMQVTFQQAWTWEDYHTTLMELKTLLADVTHPFVMLNTYLPGTRLPKGSPYPHMQRTARELPTAARTYIVTRDRIIETLIALSFKGTNRIGRDVFFCETIEEARSRADAYLLAVP